MSKFAEYKEKGKDAFIEAENTKQLEKEVDDGLKVGGDFDYSGQELQEHLLERKNEGDVKERTKYYFEEQGIMTAKATRYRTLATQGDAITRYSRRYTNHSASKRKKSARKAAAAFENVARLEQQYASEDADSVTALKHKEEIIRARLEGMKKAAEVKSRSKKNEAYRKLKAQVSCLTILKEQADNLWLNEKNTELKKQLKVEITRIDKELQKANDDITKMVPSAVSQWEKEIGIPDKVSSNLKIYRRLNPECDEESAETIMRMKNLSLELQSYCKQEILDRIKATGVFPNFRGNQGDYSRFLQFNLLPVLRDKNGRPINAAEQKKAEHNQKWIDAVTNKDNKTDKAEIKEKVNSVMAESIEYFQSLHIPSPREFRERGARYYHKKDPCMFYTIQRLTLTWDNLRADYQDAQDYEDTHPEFKKKLDAATTIGAMFFEELRNRYQLAQDNDDKIPGDKSLYGVSVVSVEDSRNAYTFSYLENYFGAYEENYKAYTEGPIHPEVSGKMNERQREASKEFLTKHSDEYGKKMRSRIDSTTGSTLSKKCMFAFYLDEMQDATEEAYENAVNKKNLTESEKNKRAELIPEKKSLQADMRKALDDFLMERQLNIGKCLEHEYFENNKEGWKQRDKKAFENLIDEQNIQLAYDWANYNGDASLGLTLVARSDKKGDYFARQIKSRGQALLGLDISRFDYKSDEDFVSKLKDNYMWLNRAESLSKAYSDAKNDRIMSDDKTFSMSKFETRLKTLKEIKADYDARIDMMNSPYYVLLANSDVQKLTDDEMLERQNYADKDISEYFKNYRALNGNSTAFKKRAKALDRENALAEENKQKQ